MSGKGLLSHLHRTLYFTVTDFKLIEMTNTVEESKTSCFSVSVF